MARLQIALSTLLVVPIAVAVAATASVAPMFMGLGDLPGGEVHSEASAVSADESIVVGTSNSSSGKEAFRWTASGGMVGLGDLIGGSFRSDGLGVSADGLTVVGRGTSASGFEAFRWTSSGMVGLGDLEGGLFDSQANSASADGSVVVGSGNSLGPPPNPPSGPEAFRWTEAGGMVGLGDFTGGSFGSVAHDVSADGSVIVGSGASASGFEVFRWTSGSGMVGLGDLPGGSFNSEAFGVSANGLVVVGRGSSTSGNEAFRWTSSSGMVGLGDLAGGIFESWALGVSADGSVVVGFGASASGFEAFIWDGANGMRELDQVLISRGLDLTGWTLTRATGISADGRTIVGVGRNPSFRQEAWIAVLPPSVRLPTLGAWGIALLVGLLLGTTFWTVWRRLGGNRPEPKPGPGRFLPPVGPRPGRRNRS